jgi:hypothetical protein
MFKNFNEFNFEVIDVAVQGTPDMLVNINGLTFSKKLVEDMNYPAFVRSLIDAENKALAIQVCKQTDDKAIKFSKPRGEQSGSINIASNVLLRTTRTMLRDEWKDDNRYRITGIYFPDVKAMVFDLVSAKEMSAFRSLKNKQK